jgi:hypothetical protein
MAVWHPVELMRLIVSNAHSGRFTNEHLAFDEGYWPRDPHANPQVAYLKASDGTWLTVTVERVDGDPR